MSSDCQRDAPVPGWPAALDVYKRQNDHSGLMPPDWRANEDSIIFRHQGGFRPLRSVLKPSVNVHKLQHTLFWNPIATLNLSATFFE